jgi:hypothetical protein
MAPKADKIMIIRHAEKPTTDGAPFGVKEDGTPGDDGGQNMLLVRGWTRAGGIAALFGRDPLGSPALATPKNIFACKAEETDSSHRPHDTVVPLAGKLGIDIVDAYGQDDYAAMIADAQGREGTVLVCWEHTRIQKITALLPRVDGPPDAYHWPGKRFDMVFVFDREGDAYRFSQVPELLLGGDSAKPIDVTKTDADGEDDG